MDICEKKRQLSTIVLTGYAKTEYTVTTTECTVTTTECTVTTTECTVTTTEMYSNHNRNVQSPHQNV